MLLLLSPQRLHAEGTDRERRGSDKAAPAVAAELALTDLTSPGAVLAALMPSADLAESAALLDADQIVPAPGAGVRGALVAELHAAGFIVGDALDAHRDQPPRGITSHITLEDDAHDDFSLGPAADIPARRNAAQSSQSLSGSIVNAIVLKLKFAGS